MAEQEGGPAVVDGVRMNHKERRKLARAAAKLAQDQAETGSAAAPSPTKSEPKKKPAKEKEKAVSAPSHVDSPATKVGEGGLSRLLHPIPRGN